MRPLLLVGCFLVLFGLNACGPLDDPANSTVSISNNVRSDACEAVGYTRTAPNFCRSNSVAQGGLIADNTCRAVATGIPASSTYIVLNTTVILLSNNAVANRTLQVIFYTENTCTFLASGALFWQVREFVATAAGTSIFRAQPFYLSAFKNGTDTNIYYVATLTTCPNCGATVGFVGYYD